MDHFNATVQKDGALVSTRRGLQVTKHKFNGISFVNTSGPAQPNGGSVGTSGKKKGPKPKAAGSTSTFSAFSTPAATPAPSGFSTFSAFSPPAATTSSNDANNASTKDKEATPAPSTAPNTSSTTTTAPKAPKSTPNGGDPANPSKPLVHRWKLVTKPTAQKAKKESNAASSATQKQRPRPSADVGPNAVSSERRPSPAVSDSAASFITTASTPDESVASFPSPFASPFLASPTSVAESIGSNNGLESLSPLSTSTLDSMGLFTAQDWEAEFISPNVEALRTSYKQNRAAAAAAKSRKNGASSYAESKARKARINALANSCQQVARSLPTWTMCHIPQLNKFEQRLFHQFFQLIPRKLYPFEDLLQYNPTRSSEFYWMVVQDRAAVRCVLLCGSMFRAVLSGANTSEELAQEVSNVCRIVNQQLAYHQKEQDKLAKSGNDSGSDDEADKMQLAAPFSPSPSPSPPASPSSASSHHRRRRHVIPEMTLECITTLALMGGSTGRYDHWHLHMQALSKMVELNGGRRFITEVRPALLFKMRKTDLKGAMALAIRPYLPFDTRMFANISDTVLLDVTRQDIRASAAALFADPACGIAPIVGQTLGSLCVFTQAVQLVRELSKTAAPLPLDPYCFSEELYWLQYHLVSQPGPLRQDVAAKDAAAAQNAETAALQAQPTTSATTTTTAAAPASPPPKPNTLLPVDTSRLQTESYVRNHRAPLAALYIVPAAATLPSTCLEPAMRIGGILYLKEFFPDFPRNLGGYAILLHLLRWHLGEGDVFDSSLLKNRSARALLLWICLVGDTVSRLANGNEERHNPFEQYDRRVFRDRLADLVRTATDVDTSHLDFDAMDAMDAMDGVDRLPESDWALCRLLDLGKIQQLGEWNDKQAVLNILLEGGVYNM